MILFYLLGSEASLIGLKVDGIYETSLLCVFFVNFGFYLVLKLSTVLQNISEADLL